MSRVLIAGASGVFGQILARELLDRTAAHLVLAGRHIEPLEQTARSLGFPERISLARLDLTDSTSVLRAADGCLAVACTAGPFQQLDPSVAADVAAAGIHWVDIADSPDWVLSVLASSVRRESGAVVIPGLSVTPCLSGILVRHLLARIDQPRRARITLFIGNRNSKGTGAISSALLARFAKPVTVQLPYGAYRARHFATADSTLLARELDLDADFRVVFELKSVNWMVSALQPLARLSGAAGRQRLARTLKVLSRPFARYGTRRGCMQAELFDDEGTRVWAAVLGTGQRMAILPCMIAIRSLLAGELRGRGVLHPVTWMSPVLWLDQLQSLGLQLDGGGGRV